MSFLAPLYFLGALAVIGPIVFHLIRRQPRGEMQFSSLMFLEKTPPKLTRRSRLENLPLLLLRCLAILLLALAFARPFLPSQGASEVAGTSEAIILLVDTSASMQRSEYWEQLLQQADVILEDAPGDALVSVIGFDSKPTTELSLAESVELTAGTRTGAAKEALQRMKPSWLATNMGAAIRYAADQAALLEGRVSENGAGNGVMAAALQTRVVLLSDLQSSGQLETLQGYQWPDRVWLDVRPIGTDVGNATLRVIPRTVTYGDDVQDDSLIDNARRLRVQVTHYGQAATSQFRLRFDGDDDDAASIQVPPGQTRYVSVELPRAPNVDASAEQGDPTQDATTLDASGSSPNRPLVLRLVGDGVEFDNAFYLVRRQRDQQRVLFLGDDQPLNTPEEARTRLSFFAAQLPWSDTTRQVGFDLISDQSVPLTLDAKEVPLLIIGNVPSETELQARIEGYLESGGRVLIVTDSEPSAGQVQTLAKLLKSPDLKVSASESDDYALIASVDFESALIAPLSDPGVNDFSSIRVWNHQAVQGLSENVRTLLQLDTGAPLLCELEYQNAGDNSQVTAGDHVGNSRQQPGKLFWLTAGWQPSESQFALSSKFVPIMLGILGPHRQENAAMLLVGEALDHREDSRTDHQSAKSDPANSIELTAQEETGVAREPGFHALGDEQIVAVNLDPRESDTTPVDIDRFSQFGAVVSSPRQKSKDKDALRALRDIEIESRQAWWQWLLLGTLGFLAAETFLSGRREIQSQDG